MTQTIEQIMVCERCDSTRVDVTDALSYACPETGYREDGDVFVCLSCGLVAAEPSYREETDADRREAAGDDAYTAWADGECF